MITSQDLRVGNYVRILDRSRNMHLPTAKIFVVGGIGLFKVDLFQSDKPICRQKEWLMINTSDLSPIPLTPEILEKCGFEHRGKRYSKNWFYLWDYEETIVFAIDEMMKKTGTYLEIQWLHQLQNIYISLTGEELQYIP